MKVLSFDPGAKRQGFAVLEQWEQEQDKSKPPIYQGSGFLSLIRQVNGSKQEPMQMYRLRLITFWVEETKRLLKSYKPDIVVSEIVPLVGGGNFVAATQSQLAGTAITTVQAMAVEAGIEIAQVAANTVKKRIACSGKATKPKVRDGVLNILPELLPRKKEWSGDGAIWEEPDAIAVGLAYLGYKNG